MSDTQKRFKVAICGAGIGGLTTAIALAKNASDVQIDIYESTEKLQEIGAGIGLWPRQWKILKKLGLLEDLLQYTDDTPKEGPVESFRFRKGDQAEGIPFFTLTSNGNLFLLHRADVQKVLLKHLPLSVSIHMKKRMKSYTQDLESVTLHFEDGTDAKADVLLGADGLKSVARKGLLTELAIKARKEDRDEERVKALKDAMEPYWSGDVAYRALVPVVQIRAINPEHSSLKDPMQYLGSDGYVLSYPVHNNTMINMVRFYMRPHLEGTTFPGSWFAKANVEETEAIQKLGGWEKEVWELFQGVEKPLQWAVHAVRPLESFAHGRVALLGDAAHGMVPHEGAGGGQAIEDAIILATVLAHPNTSKSTLAKALSIYDALRRPFAMKAMRSSQLNGQFFTLRANGFDAAKIENESGRDGLTKALEGLSKKIVENWGWVWNTTTDDMVAEAVKQMDNAV